MIFTIRNTDFSDYQYSKGVAIDGDEPLKPLETMRHRVKQYQVKGRHYAKCSCGKWNHQLAFEGDGPKQKMWNAFSLHRVQVGDV
jgi:hypothetical protein